MRGGNVMNGIWSMNKLTEAVLSGSCTAVSVLTCKIVCL